MDDDLFLVPSDAEILDKVVVPDVSTDDPTARSSRLICA